MSTLSLSFMRLLVHAQMINWDGGRGEKVLCRYDGGFHGTKNKTSPTRRDLISNLRSLAPLPSEEDRGATSLSQDTLDESELSGWR